MSPSKDIRQSIQLQDRDLAMLRGLFECRIMTLVHVTAIYFDGRTEYAKKRLQKLKRAGLVGARPRRVTEPSILTLTKNSLLLLREHGILAEYPRFSLAALLRRANVSEQTVRHELAVMDVKAAFHTAVRGSTILSIPEFGTWPRLYEFAARHPTKGTMTVKPDGFLRILEKPKSGNIIEHIFFLEVDRSTEVLDIITSRAACYLDYYRSGGFAVRNGAPRNEYRQHPFRVLIICKSAERRDNIAKRLLQCTPPILTHVCLATIAEARTTPLGKNWRRPADYRDSTSPTAAMSLLP
jgi:hypothetical protein